MYIRLNKTIMICFSLILLSCNDKTINETPVHSANSSSISSSILLEDIVEEYKYIPLETTKECLIGEIGNMQIADEYIYIQSQGVYCFDSNGKFIFAINKKGHAKSEFVNINSFNVKDGKIYVYDNSQWKVLVFNSKNGNYIKTINMPYSAVRIYGHSDKFIIDRSNIPCTKVPNDERFFTCMQNNPQKIIARYFTTKELRKSDHISQTSFITNDGFLCSDYWNNSVWKATVSGFQLYFHLDLPSNYSPPKRVLEDMAENNQINPHNYKDENVYWGLTQVQENKDFILGIVTGNKEIVTIMYEKEHSKTLLFKNIIGKDWQPTDITAHASSNNHFYRADPASNFVLMKLLMKKKNIPTKRDADWDNYNTFNKIKSEDNPVITMFKLKSLSE